MKDPRRNYLVVGTFVIAMAVVLIAWIAVLTGRTGATDRYHVVYDNVMGLKRGTEVLFEGYRVGLVAAISPTDVEGRQRFRADISVRRWCRIPEDSVAAITASGLLSAVVIDIRSGDSATELAPGSEIEGEEAANLLADVSGIAGRVNTLLEEKVEPLIDDLSMAIPSIVDDLAVLTSNLRTVVDRVNQILSPENAGRIEQTLANLEHATGDLGQTQERLDELLLTVQTLMDRDEGALGHALADLQHTLAAVARHIDAVSRNVEDTTRNLSELSLEVRRDPSLLIRGRAPSDGEESQ